MSLFGSVYEDDGAVESPVAPGAPAAVDTSPMSLQEFAAAAFDAPDASDGPSVPAVVERQFPPLPAPQDEAPEDQGVAASFTALSAPPPTATVPAAPVAESAPVAAPAVVLPPLDGLTAAPLSNDDLLPSRSGRPGRAKAPAIEVGNAGTLVKVLVVLLAGVVGFVGYRTLMGGGGSEPAPSQEESAGAVSSPGEALQQAQEVSAQADLRQAGLAASAAYAETGSFDRPLQEWESLLSGQRVVAGGSAPQAGALSVMADGDAACFETLTAAGTTAAIGVTPEGTGFASDASGASVCTTDVATLAGWSSGLPS